jgi:hypothetical protein
MMGLQFASAYLGGTLMTPLFGLISPVVGLGAWPVYLFVIFALQIFATEHTHRSIIRPGEEAVINE